MKIFLGILIAVFISPKLVQGRGQGCFRGPSEGPGPCSKTSVYPDGIPEGYCGDICIEGYTNFTQAVIDSCNNKVLCMKNNGNGTYSYSVRNTAALCNGPGEFVEVKQFCHYADDWC